MYEAVPREGSRMVEFSPDQGEQRGRTVAPRLGAPLSEHKEIMSTCFQSAKIV